MLLQFDDGTRFASGAAPFAYRPATADERYPRIHLPIAVSGFEASAIVDTGGVFLLCSPDLGERLSLRITDALAVEEIHWRNQTFSGTLHRVEIVLFAEQGENLPLEVTAFVPRLQPHQVWSPEFPLILGMHGCLEFMRFAIDLTDDTFYFGELGQPHE